MVCLGNLDKCTDHRKELLYFFCWGFGQAFFGKVGVSCTAAKEITIRALVLVVVKFVR